MRRLEIPGGSYCENWPGGRFFALAGDRVVSQSAAIAIPPTVETLLYLRGYIGLEFAGVNHADHVWEYDGFAWFDRGLACGVNAVIYDTEGNLVINPAGCPHGSQGFRYVDSRHIVTGDETYNGKDKYGLAEWTKQGDVVVGQSYVQGDACTFNIAGVRRILEPGHCWPIRMNRTGNDLAVAMWKMKENKSVLIWLTVDEIAGLPLEEAVQPQPIPTPTPEPIPMSAPDWSPMLSHLRERWERDKLNERSQPPNNPGGEPKYEGAEGDRRYQLNRTLQGVAFQNYMAEWVHTLNHPEYGLLEQASGRSNIDGYAEDYVCVKDSNGKVWSGDVIVAMGTNWSGIAGGNHRPTLEARQDAFKHPKPVAGPVPTPTPTDSTPTLHPTTPVDLKPLLDKIEELKAAVDEETRKRAALQKKLEALSDDFDKLIQLLKQPQSTGRNYSHAHGIRIIPTDNKTWD